MPKYLCSLKVYLLAFQAFHGRRLTMVEARRPTHKLMHAIRGCHIAGVIHQ